MQLDLAGVRQALERAREALAGLDAVMYQARGEELGAVLGQVDALGQACDAARVEVVGEAIARGETCGGPRPRRWRSGCCTTPPR